MIQNIFKREAPQFRYFPSPNFMNHKKLHFKKAIDLNYYTYFLLHFRPRIITKSDENELQGQNLQ